jgi:hypothetical protein
MYVKDREREGGRGEREMGENETESGGYRNREREGGRKR